MLQFKPLVKESHFHPRLQPKLKIGQIGDIYEQEADAVADRVMRMADSKMMQMQPEEEEEELLQPKIQLQPEEEEDEIVQPKLRMQLEEEEEEAIQMKCADFTSKDTLQLKSSSGGGFTSSEIAHQINSKSGGGAPLSRNTNEFMSYALGTDLTKVRVHTDNTSAQMNQELNARAFTHGSDIFFKKGQYNPSTSNGKRLLSHELTHVVQQNKTGNLPQRRTARDSISKNSFLNVQLNGEDDHFIVSIFQTSAVMSSPDPEHPLVTGSSGAEIQISFGAQTEVDLLESSGDYIRVRGDGINQRGEAVGQIEGWILSANTNLRSNTSATVENDRAAQDLDDFLDEYLIPALSSWRAALRRQGNAYLTAHSNYQTTLERANQQAQDRADFYAAVLTVVCVGALGFFGDMATNGRNFTGILRSEAARGSIEDAVQTGIGEAIDIRQGGWFIQHINRETHPLRYLNSQLEQLDNLEGELIQRVGMTKSQIRRSSIAVNRAAINVEIFDWWNGARVRNQPSTGSSESAMAREFERNFWIQYFLTEMADRTTYFLPWVAGAEDYGVGYRYEMPEDAVIARIGILGLTRQAGITEWDSWPYQLGYDYHPDPENPGEQIRYTGSDVTAQFVLWARNYEPRTFE